MLERENQLESLWDVKSYEEIWNICKEALTHANPPATVEPVTKALKDFPVEYADSANALAALYFTYQLLTAEATE